MLDMNIVSGALGRYRIGFIVHEYMHIIYPSLISCRVGRLSQYSVHMYIHT